MEMKKEYYIGLDMGTSSVGWAVTDTNYKLMRARGKDLWGVRLFSEASTSAERRVNRVARRRLQRQKVRIGYLREFFADAISAVDPGFYQRLDDSFYYPEDKKEQQRYSLFNDSTFTDKEYHTQYPTIFHLRKELIESKEPHDVRLVFLAILQMFKHRGHFLNANLDGVGTGSVAELVDTMLNSWNAYTEDITLPGDFSAILEELLPSTQYSNSKKVDLIFERMHLKKNSNKALTEAIKLICGLDGKLAVIYSEDSYDEEGQALSLSFRKSTFEERMITAESTLSETAFEHLLSLKALHDWGVLANIMRGNGTTYEYLSLARVASYDKHKKDLEVLKKLYKSYAPKAYHEMFREMKENTYSAYVGSVNYKGKVRRGAKCDTDAFFKSIQKTVKGMKDSEDKEYVLRELEVGNFLPKQLTNANGVIPNQVHKSELCAILKNASLYLDFLNQKDESGLSISDKIIQLFEFQIPYYVGPLWNNGTGNAWSVRWNGNRDKVLPWNFEEVIDTKTSAEKFIAQMVKHCTYLNDETVLPKNSLLYERFMVLNELNNLKINGTDVTVELKQELYKELFRKGKKVTSKQIRDYLIRTGRIDKKTELELSGFDQNVFTNTLANYAKFTSVFDVEVLTYEQEQMAEKLIFWSTVYGDSRKFLRSKIQEEMGDKLTKEQIKRILGMKFKDWGRLSKEFLTMEAADRDTGELKTIISRMWDGNYNLMELLSERFGYVAELSERSKRIEKVLSEFEYEDLEGLYISAPVKRMTWQTILILKELRQVIGYDPKRIFVEMARDTNAKPERKDSRKKKLADLYKGCKVDGINWSEEINNRDESEFRRKKLYLYYTQMGRCMYTGDRISLEDLFADNLYDIDHIYPRHFVKDDSLDNNLVLVRKEKNAHKQDNYPIENRIQTSMHSHWKMLLDKKLITPEKYKRLTRNTEFTDEESAAFVNRQIVETRQGTKTITELLEQSFRDTEIVYVKARNVSDFREKFDLLKCREVNDFHHANDAYLNIVVGNTYLLKFTKSPLNYVREFKRNPDANRFHMYKIFDYDVKRNKETAWIAENGISISIVKKSMHKNSPLVTRMSYEEHGKLADLTIYSAAEATKVKGVGYIPIKASDVNKNNVCRYGGFKKYTGSYFFLVEHTVKKERIRTIEAVPLYLSDQLDSIEKLEEYCREHLQYVDPSIRLKKIKMYSLLKVNGYKVYLTGRSSNQLTYANGEELKMDAHSCNYVRIIQHIKDGLPLEKQNVTRVENIRLFNILVDKHVNAIYSKRINPVGEKLKSASGKFSNLTIGEQVAVLSQILQLSSQGNLGADFGLLGGAKKVGTMKTNKKLGPDVILIHQSITGLFEREVDLNQI